MITVRPENQSLTDCSEMKWDKTGPYRGHSSLKWVTDMYVWQRTKPLPVRWAHNVVMKQNHRPISRVWISCNFYCTFLFGLATTFHLFQHLRPRSWPNTQVGSGMKFPRVTDHRSDVHIPFTGEIWGIGSSYWSWICDSSWSQIEDQYGTFSSDLCVGHLHKPNVEQDQWARDRSDIMEGTRKYSGERMNFLDSTLMHSQWKEILPL